MNVRGAVAADADEIGRVHVASLRSSHAGLLPNQFLADLSSENRAAVWRRLLTERTATHFIFVAQHAGRLMGFCACGPETTSRSDYPGEVYTLYLLAEAQGQGAGRQLLAAALGEFASRGAHRVLLWVLEENAAARGFYEHLGGKLVDQKQEDFAGVTTNQVAYGWSLAPNPESPSAIP